MLKGVVRISDKSVLFPATLALLMLMFYKFVLCECKNKMVMIIFGEKMHVPRNKPEFQTKLCHMKGYTMVL